MNPILASLLRPVTGVSAVGSLSGVFSLRSLASALSGCVGALAVLALALSATPAEAARAKYETANVTLTLAGKKLPEGVYLSGPISRMPAFYPTGESSRIVRNTYGDVLISGRLPVPEEVEKWFSTMEASRDARERLSIELTNLSREVLCSWDVLDAIPYKLEVSLQDQEQVWTVHVSTREIRYFGPGSRHNSSGGTTSSAAAASASNRSTNSGASGADPSRSSDPSTGGTSAITGNPSSSRSGSTSRSIGAGNTESRLPGTAPVVRPPSVPTPSGTEYAVTTTDGKVHQVANIIPSDDRKKVTLVMTDQRRVTFDRTQIKKIDRLARR